MKTLLESFDRLPEEAKREAAAEILKRSAAFDLPPLSDAALLESAGRVFLELDQEEPRHA